jgi:peptidoglycan-associated lipoprotein
MNKILLLAFTVLVAVAGCTTTGSKSGSQSAAVEDQSSTGDGADSNVQTYATGSRSTTGMNALEDPSHPLYNLLQERTIYFEYDKSEIQEQYRDIVEAHATYLSEHPDVNVTLEGHADERGSREYNLALGERRAIAVERQLTLLGVQAAQIRTVSYGEERPISTGHDESSWSRNRRVEIIY